MIKYNIASVSDELLSALKAKIDNKTKPIGALGDLESLALKIGQIQNTLNPTLHQPHLLVFAGDHGIAKDGVSAYPQEVTYQMVLNFLHGGAAINVFCRQHQIELSVIDAGVIGDFESNSELLDAKIGQGTRSFLREPAMSEDQCVTAMTRGKGIVQKVAVSGTNIIGFGEMGIGNTSAASMLMSVFCGLAIEDCVGRGTGLNDDQLQNKIQILEQSLNVHKVDKSNPMKVLSTYAGFEMAMMCGAMLAAAEHKMTLLIDGFISTSVFLAASHFDENILDYAVFCHQSDEYGHGKMLQHLHVKPLLNLGMRLGEGTGCALAFPLIESSMAFLEEMASFESAGVSTSDN